MDREEILAALTALDLSPRWLNNAVKAIWKVKPPPGI
jgi:hypothetical protein